MRKELVNKMEPALDDLENSQPIYIVAKDEKAWFVEGTLNVSLENHLLSLQKRLGM